MQKDFLYIDYEFCNVNDELVTLVCCTTEYLGEVKEWWLHRSFENQTFLRHYLQSLKHVPIIAYAATAEGRSYLSLDLDPMEFEWIDLFIEFRMLTNNNDKLNWGNQLVDGKVKFTVKPPPKWERTEEDTKQSFKHTHSLAEATYKLTGKIRDTAHKDVMRDLIISAPDNFTEKEQIEIQKYCTQDVIFLKEMFEATIKEYESLGIAYDEKFYNQMLLRGRYSAITAKIESWGYPINYQATKNFSDSVGPILERCQREINSLFPEIKPFKYDRLKRKFSWDQTVTKEWLRDNVDVKSWTKTDSYKAKKKEANANGIPFEAHKYLSLSGEAWEKKFPYRHHYPKDNFGAQMVRYLKLKKDMNGFVISPNKRSFWDSVGPDKRVRSWTNPYGAQSSRNQQPSTSFLFLKPAWMRVLCEPPPGKAIADFDWGSVEFLISALWSEDENMIEAYRTGDVYLAYGKLIGAIPPDGTKKTHGKERQAMKAIVLGMSYLMSKYGLAPHLTENTGIVHTEEEAEERIEEFKEAFPGLAQKQRETIQDYEEEGLIELACGWMMMGDNDNFRSVCNVGIQGLSASILRKAVTLAIESGLKVVMTLHDAIYIEYDIGDFAAIDTLYRCMREAFIFYFDDKESAGLIKQDGFTWCREYSEGTITTPGGLVIGSAPIFVDERAKDEYEQFKKYFEDRMENYL